MQAGSLELVDSTLSGNSAREDGGGVALTGGALTSFNSTLADNLADGDGNGSGNGGGISQTGNAAVGLKHTLLASNRDGSSGTQSPDCAGTIASTGYNLIGVTQGCTVTAQEGDRFNIEARIGLLADNGGASLTHALLTGSPGIDGGDPAGCFNASAQVIVVDQRGFARPRDGDGDEIARCDIGAYELQPAQIDPIFAAGFE